MRRAGGRFNQTRDKVSFGPSSGSVVTDKSEVIHEFKSEARDTTGKLIKQVLFNYQKGNYAKHLIKTLRGYLNDPKTSKAALIRIVFSPTDKDNEAEANRLATYIDMYSVYLVGIGIKGVHFEFGKYPNNKPTELKEPKESEKKMKKIMKKAKQFDKPMKQNKKEKQVVDSVKERQLPDSHLLGFDEGYGGSGITSPCDVTFWRESLKSSIKEICASYHKPEYRITNEICFTWKKHLTVITVMVCEAARFHPMCWYFSNLITKGEKSLRDDDRWLDFIIKKWSAMSKVHSGEHPSVPYRNGDEKIPQGFSKLTTVMVEELCKDKAWVKVVLAVLCR